MKSISNQKEKKRLLSRYSISPEELAKRKAKRVENGHRCRIRFEELKPHLIQQYYNWFIAINPNNKDYLIDKKIEDLIKQIEENFIEENAQFTIFQLNETGTCGKI